MSSVAGSVAPAAPRARDQSARGLGPDRGRPRACSPSSRQPRRREERRGSPSRRTCGRRGRAWSARASEQPPCHAVPRPSLVNHREGTGKSRDLGRPLAAPERAALPNWQRRAARDGPRSPECQPVAVRLAAPGIDEAPLLVAIELPVDRPRGDAEDLRGEVLSPSVCSSVRRITSRSISSIGVPSGTERVARAARRAPGRPPPGRARAPPPADLRARAPRRA